MQYLSPFVYAYFYLEKFSPARGQQQREPETAGVAHSGSTNIADAMASAVLTVMAPSVGPNYGTFRSQIRS